MLTIHKASHVDHALTPAQLDFIVKRFEDRTAFFIEPVELPSELGQVPCGLHGPLMGDAPVTEGVQLGIRGTRPYPSRLVRRPTRLVSTVTVIAGPHEDPCPGCGSLDCVDGVRKYECIVYTAFGGPLAPKEPGETGAAVLAFVEENFGEGWAKKANEMSLRDGLETIAARLRKLEELRAEYVKSKQFWAEHALSL